MEARADAASTSPPASRDALRPPVAPAALRDAYDAEGFRRAAHEAVDQLADYLSQITAPAAKRLTGRAVPVLPWTAPDEALAEWRRRLSAAGAPGAELAERLRFLLDGVLAGATHLHHPRYTGHQVPPVLPAAVVGDLVASLLNNSVTIYEMGGPGTVLEREAIRWMADVLGLGDRADGVLTSGGSLGNLTALLAARQLRSGFDAWSTGLAGERPLAVLGSSAAHYSVARSLQVMGLGKDGFVPVQVDERLRLRPEALEEAFDGAERTGRRVFAVVASSCATAAGTFDPLEEIADFCAARGLWLHVDGAHGAAAALSDQYRHLVAGIERADSVVWDAHKLLLVPSLVTGVVFREAGDAYAAFEHEASYLYEGRDIREWFNISRRTLECTKPMLALRLWCVLAAHGREFFAAYIDHVFGMARRFGRRIAAAPDFELPVEPESNIVAFRYVPADGARFGTEGPDRAGGLDRLQTRIRRRLIESGEFYLTQARLPAGVHLRTVLMNPLTTDGDLDALLDGIREAARDG
ncbi:MAG TPA: pyridoxal-dependent decarboxylase [Gemmatimonadota bacterium]|nr:pyridoxal-dependent decarboxylase [Gemmatimonadota bacterium]